MLELYFILFFDSIISSFVFPLHNYVIFKGMYLYNEHYNLFISTIIMLLGSSIGFIMNYFIGSLYFKVNPSKLNILNKVYFKFISMLPLLFSAYPLIGGMVIIFYSAKKILSFSEMLSISLIGYMLQCVVIFIFYNRLS